MKFRPVPRRMRPGRGMVGALLLTASPMAAVTGTDLATVMAAGAESVQLAQQSQQAIDAVGPHFSGSHDDLTDVRADQHHAPGADLPALAQDIVYPQTERVDHVDEYHGSEVEDPYRWLEANAKEDEAVAAWVEARFGPA